MSPKMQDKSTDAAGKPTLLSSQARHEAGDGAARLGALLVLRRTVFTVIAMGCAQR
jgi:hypothetical protein